MTPDPRGRFWRLALLATTALFLAPAACVDEDKPCGSWTYSEGFCHPPVDAAPDTNGGADGGLSDPCTSSDQCGQSASYCAYDPGKGVGICTIKNCNLAPDDCPSGWKCWDGPNAYPGVGLPTMCLPADQVPK